MGILLAGDAIPVDRLPASACDRQSTAAHSMMDFHGTSGAPGTNLTGHSAGSDRDASSGWDVGRSATGLRQARWHR